MDYTEHYCIRVENSNTINTLIWRTTVVAVCYSENPIGLRCVKRPCKGTLYYDVVWKRTLRAHYCTVKWRIVFDLGKKDEKNVSPSKSLGINRGFFFFFFNTTPFVAFHFCRMKKEKVSCDRHKSWPSNVCM